MKATKKKRLEAAGWRVGSAAEFLGLSAAEERIVEIKLALAVAVRQRRARLGLTQGELAQRMGSSQSRVAKLEAGDRTVSIDLLVSALLRLGLTRQQLGRILASDAA
ncbi:MAG: helix-turn-helix domain-containing protein [Planctomycetes bacterium]|nr:helix-turn-helix domain-containing protein [Planctomycetota bacterium]